MTPQSITLDGHPTPVPRTTTCPMVRAVLPNGDTYSGDFENGRRHGVGTFCTDTYKGLWRENKFHGLGTLHFVTGEMYHP